LRPRIKRQRFVEAELEVQRPKRKALTHGSHPKTQSQYGSVLEGIIKEEFYCPDAPLDRTEVQASLTL
jgi:hypothetical protein